MKVVGLDSASHLGLVLLSGNEETRCKAIEVNQKGFVRLQSIAAEVRRTLIAWDPDFVVMERYAYCKNIDAFITIVEIGTVVKNVIYELGIECIDVPPTVVKKFATGKGNADKPMMAEAAKQKCNFINSNHDIVDAFWLAKMGTLGTEELKKLLAPKIKKKRKKK